MSEQNTPQFNFKQLAQMRKGWILHPAFQVKILNKRFQMAILTYGLSIGGGTLGLCLYIFSCYVAGMRLSDQEKLFTYFRESSFQTSYFHIVVGLFILVFFITYTFHITHKVAGPIYKLQKSMKEAVKEDRFEHLEFRPGDYLIEFKDDYNALMDKIKQAKNNT